MAVRAEGLAAGLAAVWVLLRGTGQGGDRDVE